MSVTSLRPKEFIEASMQIYRELAEIEDNVSKAEKARKVTIELPVSLDAFVKKIDVLARDQLAKVEGPYKNQITLCNEKCDKIQTRLDTVHFVRLTNLMKNTNKFSDEQEFLGAIDQIEKDMTQLPSTSSLAMTSNTEAMRIIAKIRRICDPKPPVRSSSKAYVGSIIPSKEQQESLLKNSFDLIDQLTAIESRLKTIDFEKAPYEIPASFKLLDAEVTALKNYQINDTTLKKKIQLCLEKHASIKKQIDEIHLQIIQSISLEIKNFAKKASTLWFSEKVSQYETFSASLLKLKTACISPDVRAEIEQTEKELQNVKDQYMRDDEKYPVTNAKEDMDISGRSVAFPELLSDEEESDEEDDATILEELRQTNPEAYAVATGILSSS